MDSAARRARVRSWLSSTSRRAGSSPCSSTFSDGTSWSWNAEPKTVPPRAGAITAQAEHTRSAIAPQAQYYASYGNPTPLKPLADTNPDGDSASAWLPVALAAVVALLTGLGAALAMLGRLPRRPAGRGH